MAPKIPKKALNEIQNTIKYVWEYDISNDYNNSFLLKEDTLKNSLYFHIRTRLSALLEKYNVMIFTEFNSDKFEHTGFRADMIIAQIDSEKSNKYHLRYCITNYISVIEIKFKSDYSKANEDIYNDYIKTEKYINSLNLGDNCHYYIATIWECYPDSKWWIDKNAAWAKGKVTELNADYNNKYEMNFYIREH